MSGISPDAQLITRSHDGYVAMRKPRYRKVEAMQEDVLGPLHSLGYSYETCSLCGTLYPMPKLTPRESAPALGDHSEREDVCPDCRRLRRMGGEPGFATDDENAADAEGRW